MSLPNPSMDAVPFNALTAEFVDDMIENIEALSDGSGIVSLNDEKVNVTVGVNAYLAGTQSVASEATIIFGNEIFDVGADYNTSTGVFTAPVTGYYLVTANIGVSNIGDGQRLLLRIKHSGVTVALITGESGSASGDPRVNATKYLFLTAADTVTITGQSSTSSSVDGGESVNYLTIAFMGT